MEPLKVLYEDNHIIIVLKEPNELVQGDDMVAVRIRGHASGKMRLYSNRQIATGILRTCSPC